MSFPTDAGFRLTGQNCKGVVRVNRGGSARGFLRVETVILAALAGLARLADPKQMTVRHQFE